MLPKFSYVRPKSLNDAANLLSAEGTVLHAGGTDLLGCLRERVIEAKTVVSLSGVQGLSGIEKTSEGGLRIGALTTITEIAEHPLVGNHYTALAQGASEVASPQLRNQGTIGGNLCQKPRCWYYRGDFHCLRKGGDMCYAVGGENAYHCIFGGDMCYIVHPSDTAPALAAFEATFHITGPKGRRAVRAGEFHMPPSKDPQRETVLSAGEILTAVTLPPPGPGLRSSYRKVRARRSWDFALAGVALALAFDSAGTVKRARVVLSGAAPIPWRSKEVEDAVTGRKLTDETIQRAAEAVVRNAEPLEQNGYKLPLFRGIIKEELSAMAGER